MGLVSWIVVYILTTFTLVPVLSDSVKFFPAPPKADDPGLIVLHLNVSTARQEFIPLVLTTVNSPVGFVHVLPSTLEGCTERVKTSDIAETAGCHFAVNGKCIQ